MLINLRNALMAGKRLPYDAEVEFLQSDGQVFVNTGFVVEAGSKITCNIGMSSSYGSTYGYFGASDGTGSYLGGGFNCASPFKDRRLSVWVKNKLWWCSTARATDIYQDGALHSMSIDLSSSTPSVSFDGQSISYAAGYISGVAAMPSIPTYLFAVNSAGTEKTVPASAALKIGSFRVEKNGETKLDIIAVRKGTVGYLYDRVSGKLFGNAGTGDFVLGPDVVPVEYIESHGTEWIDTGVYGSDAVKATLDLQLISLGRARGVFGAYSSTSSSLYVYQAGGGSDVWQVGFGYYKNTTKKTDTERHDVELYDFHVDIDGETIATFSQSQFTTSHTMTIFTTRNQTGGVYTSFGSRCYRCGIWQSNIPVRSFYPVRVGTDATSWEGAMIDTLTRRIYRNAGTGAFTYGNDLKYPIPAE